MLYSFTSPLPLEPSSFLTLSALMSPPANLIPSVTAAIIALLVTVAPDMASTAKVCPSIIALGILSIAGSDIPGLSLCSRTFMLLILLSSTVTSTFISPLCAAADAL